jgi:hypothetical protein
LRVHIVGSLESDPLPLAVEFTGLRGSRGGGGPLDPAGTGALLPAEELLISPTSGEPLRPVRDPSSAAGRVMIGGDNIPVCSLIETAAVSLVLSASLSAHAPRWVMRDGTCSCTELVLCTTSCCCLVWLLPSCMATLFRTSEGCLLPACCSHRGGFTDDCRGGGCIDKRRSSTMDGGSTSAYFRDLCCSMRAICYNKGGKNSILQQCQCCFQLWKIAISGSNRGHEELQTRIGQSCRRHTF